MSNAPHKAADVVNIFGIVLIGVASALLLWATAVALQGYYLKTSGPVEGKRASMELETERRSIQAAQVANLHRSEENTAYQGSAEACYRNPIEAAMRAVVADAEDDSTTLVPAVGPSTTRSVAPIPGYPDPDGLASSPAVPVKNPKLKITDTNIESEDAVQFEPGTPKILATSNTLLEEIGALMVATPRLQLVEIGGHTSNDGDAEALKALSTARAEAIKAFLVTQGVAADRLTAAGYGATKPIGDNATPEGKAANERIELVIIKAEAAPAAPGPAAPAPAAPAPAPTPEPGGATP